MNQICDGMELSCINENKYLKSQGNIEKILGDDIDDDLFYFCIRRVLIMKNTNLDEEMLAILDKVSLAHNVSFWGQNLSEPF